MKRLCLMTLVAGAMLAFGAVAGAHAPSSATKIVLDHSSQQSGENTNLRDFVGHLESPRKKCLAGRTVKFVLHDGNSGTTKLVDTDRTGKDGAWAVGGNIIGADVAHFRVTRKTIGRHHRRRVCKADSTSMRFA